MAKVLLNVAWEVATEELSPYKELYCILQFYLNKVIICSSYHILFTAAANLFTQEAKVMNSITKTCKLQNENNKSKST